MMSKTSHIVSIGMPVYNGERYIKEALDSLICQSYSNFELIISDNASTDNTKTICEEYACKDSRIKYVRQKANMGPVYNFQYVLDMAESEFFMWAAHDDVWSLNWLESLLESLDNNKNVIGAYGKLIHIDENSIEIYSKANGKNLNYKGCLRRIKYYIEPECMGKANVFYSIFRRDVLLYLDLDSKYDYEALFYLLKKGDIIQNNNSYLKKRVHDASLGNFEVNKVNEGVTAKLISIFANILPMTDRFLLPYLVKSNFFESLIIVVLFPLKYLTYKYIQIKSKFINRIIRDGNR